MSLLSADLACRTKKSPRSYPMEYGQTQVSLISADLACRTEKSPNPHALTNMHMGLGMRLVLCECTTTAHDIYVDVAIGIS